MFETSYLIKFMIINLLIVTYFKILYFNYQSNKKITIFSLVYTVLIFFTYLLFPLIAYFYFKNEKYKELKLNINSKNKNEQKLKLKKYKKSFDRKLFLYIFKLFIIDFETILKDFSSTKLEVPSSRKVKKQELKLEKKVIFKILKNNFKQESEGYCHI